MHRKTCIAVAPSVLVLAALPDARAQTVECPVLSAAGSAETNGFVSVLGEPVVGSVAGAGLTLASGAIPCWVQQGSSTSVTITAANPPLDNPYLTGTQPFRDVLQPGGSAVATQGIGVTGTPSAGTVTYAPISVTFSGAPSPAPSASNVTVACTDAAGNGSADCPNVASVTGSGSAWNLTLTAPLPARECTTITFAGTAFGQKLQYQVLPGDVSMNGSTNSQDLLALITALNNGTANLASNLARYNVNRSLGASPVNSQDLLRLVQLLNGTNTTQVFNGATVAACP